MARRGPEKKPAEQRVLPMELQVGDRLTDETAEWEVIGRPYTTNMRKSARMSACDASISRRSPRSAPWSVHEHSNAPRT
jgi:hypothetical protein